MRLNLICLFLMSIGLIAGLAFSVTVDVGSSIGVGGEIHSNTSVQDSSIAEAAKNTTQPVPNTQEHGINATSDKGISEQVQQIIEDKKSGSITVPQGMLVRIIAHNHTLSVEDATTILNETLLANLSINGKSKSFRLEPETDGINITDENVTVSTNEAIEIENDSFLLDGMKVLVMPSEVPGKIKTSTIRSAVLHIAGNDVQYNVNATRKAKVLWVFDADMDVEVDLSATSGSIINENRPWWSFMASTE